MKTFLKYFGLVTCCVIIGIISIEFSKNNSFRTKVESIVKSSKQEKESVESKDNLVDEKKDESAFEISVISKEETKDTNSAVATENSNNNETTTKGVEETNESPEIVTNDNNKEKEISTSSINESSSDENSTYNEIDVSTVSIEENSNSSNDVESESDNIINILELDSTSSNTTKDSFNNNATNNNTNNTNSKNNNSSDSKENSNSVSKNLNDTETKSIIANNSNKNTIANHSTATQKNTSTSKNQYTNSTTGTGKGPVEDINIQYHVKDSNGRCGKGSTDYCAAVATVKYTTGTVKYYMGYQNNSQIIGGSCRSHAFMAATNAIKETTYSTLDLQKYLYSLGYNGVLKAKGITKSIEHYGLTAKVYHSETSKKKAATLIKTALDNGQPVMIFVQHSLCSDLAGTHHALLLLGYDKNNKVVFIDSVPYSRNAKKRTVSEISKCLSKDSISDSYYRMIIFSF